MLQPAMFVAFLMVAATSLGGAEEAEDYRVGPEDIVSIQSWNRGDLSGDFLVTLAGTLILPHMGEVQAAGFTEAELSAVLTQRYKLLFPGFSETVLTVKEPNSRSITVVGEVRASKTYAFLVIPNVWEDIHNAGSYTAASDLARVQIVRRDGEPRMQTVDLSMIPDGVMPDSLPVLRPGDTVNVPSLVGEAVTTAGATVQVFGAVRTPGVYPLSAAASVVEALARSGGPLPEARLTGVQLTRTTGQGTVAYKLDLQALLSEGKTVANFELREGDTLFIPQKRGTGTLLTGLVTFLPLITSLTSLVVVLQN